MGARNINPRHNIHEGHKYKKMLLVNPYAMGLDISTNVFYGLQNNLWSVSANWSRGHVPLSSETATIRANCTLDASPTVDQLIIESGKTLTASNTTSRTLTVNNNCSAYGSVNLSGDKGHTLVLKGAINVFANTINNGTVKFAGSTQTVPGVQYNNVIIDTAGTKTLTGDAIMGTLTFTADVYAALDLAAYGLTVNGATDMQRRSQLLKSVNNSKVSKHIGLLSINNGGSAGYGCTINLGTNTLEVCNGITETSSASIMTFTLGKLKFSTNSQNSSLSNLSINYVAVEIEGAITVTIPSGRALNVLSANGTVSGSSLVNTGGTLQYIGTTDMMATGSLVPYNNSASTISLYSAGNWTVTSVLTTNVRNLNIGGAGIKKIQNDLVVQGNLNFLADTISTLDLDAYSLTVNGTTSMNRGAKIIKSTDDGKLVKFIGAYSCDTGGGPFAPNSITINVGTSQIEFCGGVTRNGGANTLYWTYSKIVFSTNNQNINMGSFNFAAWTDVLIKGAITVSNFGQVGIVKITGDNVSSKYFNRSTTYWYGVIADLMPTGILDVTSTDNTFMYSLGSNQTVKGISYKTVGCNNGSVKTADGNITADYIVLQNSTVFDLATYDLTCYQFPSGGSGTLRKSGAGNILFTGYANFWTCGIDFSGNPTQEYRAGISLHEANAFNFGTGAVKFSTNNQGIGMYGGSVPRTNIFGGDITIEGAITVRFEAREVPNVHTWQVNGNINGTVSGSTLLIGTSTVYKGANQPMDTGTFTMSDYGLRDGTPQGSYPNVIFNYNRTGAQAVKGGTYNCLTLSGSGTKTLQGNVSVLKVFSDTGGLKDNNGYTFGNP